MPFFRTKLPKTPPKTAPKQDEPPPHTHASQIAAEYVTQAQGQARRAQIAFFVVLAGLLWSVWNNIHQATQSHFEVRVVDRDRHGRVIYDNGNLPLYTIQDNTVAWQLEAFIRQTRSLPTDEKIMSDWSNIAYDWCTARGKALLREYGKTEQPELKFGKEAVDIEILRMVKASSKGDTWDVTWRETTRKFKTAELVGREEWTAIFTVIRQPAGHDKELGKNPAGVLFDDWQWHRVRS